MDGFDKLKPYGFPIHACMDGFSRKVLWLEVSKQGSFSQVVWQMLTQKCHYRDNCYYNVSGERFHSIANRCTISLCKTVSAVIVTVTVLCNNYGLNKIYYKK